MRLILVSSLILSACVASPIDGDLPELTGPDTSDGEKADLADIPLTVVQDNIGNVAATPTQRLFTNAGSYALFFGHAPPASVSFANEWVVFYAAGVQNSGGYQAAVDRVRLSSDGRTLNVTTRLTSPGVDCVSIAVLTTPYALVKFAKPSPLVGFWRSEHVDLTENCSQPTTCAAIGGHCLSSPIDPTFAADCAADYGLVASSSGTCAAINETCCVM